MTSLELFPADAAPMREQIGPSAFVLRGFALPHVGDLLQAIAAIEASSAFRNMVTPGGYTMSVAMTNCGQWGWTTDRKGYHYSAVDPQSGRPWPTMPEAFDRLAKAAAKVAGFDAFSPDACLVNRYLPGSRLSLHQDKNELDFNVPIVSVSLGMTATFLFGGHERADRPVKIPLRHGDVAVWGGEDRLRYHGVMPLKGLPHEELGEKRINFTFRKAR